VKQALWNLLRNAAEVTTAGGAVVLSLAPAADGAGLCFEVRDEGPGIPPEDRERVFDPFYTTKERGTGIGLAVVRRVAERHGGTVTVRPSPDGRGSVFALALPGGVR
jgi:signal transduction histidine kinase